MKIQWLREESQMALRFWTIIGTHSKPANLHSSQLLLWQSFEARTYASKSKLPICWTRVFINHPHLLYKKKSKGSKYLIGYPYLEPPCHSLGGLNMCKGSASKKTAERDMAMWLVSSAAILLILRPSTRHRGFRHMASICVCGCILLVKSEEVARATENRSFVFLSLLAPHFTIGCLIILTCIM